MTERELPVRPTIRDVAGRAGVSLATASHVLSRGTSVTIRVSEPTRERVRAAAAELGYVASQAARGMRRGRTDRVAVAIWSLEWPWDRSIAEAAARVLPEHGYQVVILLGDAWRQFMLSGGADGVILGVIPEGVSEDATMVELARRGVAQVVVSDAIEIDGVDVVAPQPEVGIAAGIDYLTARHHRIACIRRRPQAQRTPPSRYSGYAEGLRRAGLPVDEDLVRTSYHRRDDAYAAALSLLRMDDPPSAIFATDDMEALQALRAAFRLGLRVPEDVEIVGVGNSTEGLQSDPPLTTVGPDPFFDRICAMMLDRLEGRAPTVGVRVPAPWRLHVRGTTRSV